MNATDLQARVVPAAPDRPRPAALDSSQPAPGGAAAQPLLAVHGLHVSFRARGGVARRTTVLRDTSFVVRPGEIVGVIGETGSGKTTLARAIAGLIRPDAGSVALNGRDISALRRGERRRFRRGGAVRFVFQDPLRALDPDLTIGRSVAEGLAISGRGTRESRRALVAEALRRVGLDPAVADRLPGAISGGQRQRASIARAIVDNPRLLICDEPVSALDGSNRNLILRLLDELRRGRPTDTGVDADTGPRGDINPGETVRGATVRGDTVRGDTGPRAAAGAGDDSALGVIVISHDLSSLAGIADRVVVLYRGRVVEDGPIAEVFTRPRHPYTALLIASAPSIRDEDGPSPAQLRRPADQPAADGAGTGREHTRRSAQPCVFAHRCPFATDTCAETPQPVASSIPTWSVACHHADDWRTRLKDPQTEGVN